MDLQKLKLWAGRVFFGDHLLEKVKMVPLRSPIAEAITPYGEPVETKPSEKFPEATQHTFEPSIHHGVTIAEWKGVVHTVTYWSAYGDPQRDLWCMFKRYGEDQKWDALNAGYLYYRADREVMLWCSAIPAIGVGTIEYQQAETAAKKTNTPTETDGAGLTIYPES